jgi:hypothetical protein
MAFIRSAGIMTAAQPLHLTVLALHWCLPETGTRRAFRYAENSHQAIAGNITSIVHTAAAFNPTAQQAAPQETA